MGQKQSRERMLYEHAKNGEVDSIRALSRQGASLEWKDKEGKTPLIVAAKDGRLYNVAKTLIQLGANVNAFSKGHQTPLHCAAKQGLQETVALLISHGANPFVKNSKHQRALDIARDNDRHAVVHEIESRISYFAGDIREVFGPGFSDASAPQLSSRVIWVVVVPRSAHNPSRRPRLELVIYSNPQDAEARKILSLRKCKIKGPKFEQPSPALIIFDKHTKTRYKFTSVTEGDKQQLRRLYNACKGISQVMPSSARMNPEPMASPLKLSGIASPRPRPSPNTCSSPNRLSPWMNISSNNISINKSPTFLNNHGNKITVENWATPNQSPAPHTDMDMEMDIGNNIDYDYEHHPNNIHSPVVQTPDISSFPRAVSPAPSAPPMISSSDDFSSPSAVVTRNYDEGFANSIDATNDDDTKLGSSGLCVVCWEAPVEGACVPCGHVSGCMSCLQVVKAKNGFCPVCRTHIHQVIKLYGV